MTKALATLSQEVLLHGDFDSILKRSSQLVKSGLLPAQVKTPEQAAIIMLTAAEIGVPPMKALRNLYVINGKVDFEAPLVLELVERVYGDNALVYLSDQSDSTKAVVRVMKQGWDSPQYVTYTIEEAKNAGLTGKENWKKYPTDMLASRAITRAARRYFSAALGGAAYTPEEIARDNTWTPTWEDDEGNPVIDITTESNGHVDEETGEIVEGEAREVDADSTGVPTDRQASTQVVDDDAGRGASRTDDPSADDPPASDKQKNYIHGLLKQKDQEADINFDTLTKSEASEWIESLQNLPDAEPEPEKPEIDYSLDQLVNDVRAFHPEYAPPDLDDEGKAKHEVAVELKRQLLQAIKDANTYDQISGIQYDWKDHPLWTSVERAYQKRHDALAEEVPF